MKRFNAAICCFISGLFFFNSLQARDGVEQISLFRLSLNIDGHQLKTIYDSNRPLESNSEHTKRAIIVIHGANRNSGDYYERVLSAVRTAQKTGETIIIAPQFITAEDITRHQFDDDILYWRSSGWKKGDKSRNSAVLPRPARISSFSVIDSLCFRLAQHQINLEKIIVIGHSAGGQFVNRYAAGSKIENILKSQYGIEFTYIIANPSSYLYFDKKRRIAGTMDQFTTPATACLTYNDYKYGLEKLNNYMASTGIEQITRHYAQRKVIYLLGEKDDDPYSESLDIDCEAMLQGEHRLERGKIYYNYLGHYFGTGIYQSHRLAIVHGVGHSSSAMFNSFCGLFVMLDYGNCATMTSAVESEARITKSFQIELFQNYPNPFNSCTNIQFSLSQRQIVRIAVFDITGRQVLKIIEKEYLSGTHSLLFKSDELPNGLYFIVLKAGLKTHLRKALLLR